jgi:hypothetical protein
MKKYAIVGLALILCACGNSYIKYYAAKQASDSFLQACINSTVDYQITGDNTNKTFTVHCSIDNKQ